MPPSPTPSAPSAPPPLQVLLVGAGMYVRGIGPNDHGTVLPALFEASRREGLVGAVHACATSPHSARRLLEKGRDLEAVFGHPLALTADPESGDDREAWRKAIARRGGPRQGGFDCAIVVVPDPLHYEVASGLLDAGLPVYLVKPFVTRFADGAALVRQADEAGLYGGVEFHKRFDHSNLLMRDALRAGRIGEPLHFHIEYSQRKTIPADVFAAWARETNIFQYLGVHYVDMVYFLTGARPLRVMALGQKRWLAGRGIDTCDAMQVVVEWQSATQAGGRFVSTHLTNWIDPNASSAMSDQRILAVGTEGRIDCDQKHRGVQIVTDRDGVQDVNPYFSQFYGDLDGQGGRQFSGYGCESFIQFLRDVRDLRDGRATLEALNRSLRPTFRSSMVSTAVVEAANTSLNAGEAWAFIGPELDPFMEG